MRVHEGEGATIFTPAESTLIPGALWTKDSPIFRAGIRSVVVTLREGERLVYTDPVEFRIDNTARDAALRACTACNGVWDVRGLASVEGCNCSTNDAGNLCADGNDCQGSCMFERFEVVRPGLRTCDPGGSCFVQPELGRAVGRCSGSIMSFGCKSRIEPGASMQPPVVLPSRAPLQCVD